jgi:Na+-transporting NADH:ubiquinone oxidoreductase subunit NqrB
MKSDALVYVFAVLLGISAGLLEIMLGDVLITSLFVLVSTLVLGYIRPRRAWRWILVVGIFVPIIQFAAYFLLAQTPYRAQIWESGLGFVTGTAGCYCGAFARKGVDELIRTNK